ncbi:pentapeptide repeat-containing protein [Dyella monticola]
MECKLADSRWTGAALTRVQAGGGADWSRADLQRVAADHSSWRDGTLADANLMNGEFRECDFSGTRLQGAVLEHGLFYRSLFMGGVLTACHAESADFFQAMCRRADFRAADLQGANFVQAECTEARFDDARLEGIRIEPGRRLRG